MKLICSLTSPYARRVRVLAHELGVVDQIDIEIVKPRESSDHLWTINPLGKIPTLQLENGSAIYDSLIICDYLVDTFSPGWGINEQVDYWAYRTRLSLLNQIGDAGSQSRKLSTQDPPQHKAAEFQLNKIQRSLTHIENTWPSLETELSIASIGLGCTFDYLLYRLPEVDWTTTYPRISGWHTTFHKRESMRMTQIPMLS